MLGMIIGVGAVITMVALGRGAQTTIEEQVKAAGTNMININAGNFSPGRRAPGPGQLDDAHAGGRAGAARRARRAVRRRGRQQPRPGDRRQPELVDPDSGHRSRLSADPQLADQVRLASSRSRTSTARRRSPCSGTVVANTLFGEDVDPTGQIIRIRNQPFKVIGVMASKGTGGDGQRPGRRDLHARTRRCRRSCRASSTSTTSPCRPRQPRRHRSPPSIAADAAHCATSSSATIRTTSWSGRSRRWPASAPRRPRR